MKNRLAKEVRETQELFRQFRQIKAKCSKVIEQHGLRVPEIDSFRDLELQFVVDLNLLSIDMITSRRNKINQAIDEIMMIESSLNLRILKKNSQNKGKDKEQQEATSQATIQKQQSTVLTTQESDKIITVKPTTKKQVHTSLMPSNDYLDPQEITSIRNQYIFDHEDLQNVWTKNKGLDGQDYTDKIDRMSKVVAILKSNSLSNTENVKQISDKERQTNKNLGLQENKHYSQLISELEEQKIANKQLQKRNMELAAQVAQLKMEMQGKPSLDRCEFPGKITDILFQNDEFRIIKVQAPKRETRHSSLEKTKSIPETTLPNILKYIFLLQERIVDGLSLGDTNSRNPESIRLIKHASITSNLPLAITKRQIPESQYVARHSTIDEKRVEPCNPSANNQQGDNLKDLGVKLQEIRKQRRKIFQDDIWNEIENLKL